ncbi:MAG TPA: glycosyltransferase [Chthoniobacterales bacterium]
MSGARELGDAVVQHARTLSMAARRQKFWPLRDNSAIRVSRKLLTLIREGVFRRQAVPAGFEQWLAAGRKSVTRARAALASSRKRLTRFPGQPAPAPPPGDPGILVNCLYRTGLGRFADEAGLKNAVQALQAGGTLHDLARGLVRSAEFQFRHGPSEKVDTRFITALYRDGLGRQPDLDAVFYFLKAARTGVTRVEILASIAASNETREHLFPNGRDPALAYQHWVAANDTLGQSDRAIIRVHLAGLANPPLVSLILPAFGTSESALRSTINAVTAQLFPGWELWIVADAAAAVLLTGELSGAFAFDPRVRLIGLGLGENLLAGINNALQQTNGEFVAFVHPGDLLAEQALYEVVSGLPGCNQTDVFYTDHDHLDALDLRTEPWFKPGWDPDFLLGQDYLNPLVVYRRSLVEAIGFLRPAAEEAAYYDLALRATAATLPSRIRHVPAVLYHKRTRPVHSEQASTAGHEAGALRRVVREFLEAGGYADAAVTPIPQLPFATRVIWPLPTPEPLVSVLVPIRDRVDLLAQCAKDVLRNTDYQNLELLILDNGSVEPATLCFLDDLTKQDSRARVLRLPGPFNYSALNNAGARAAKGEVLLLLNNDIVVIEPGWLREMVSQAVRPDVGIVGAKLLYADQRVQHGGVVCGPGGAMTHVQRNLHRHDPGYLDQLRLARTLSAVTGACMAIRRAVFFEVGGLDEVNLPVAFNDLDLCLKVGDRGYRVVWSPFAELMHLESASRGKDSAPEQQAQFRRESDHMRKTWGALLEDGDPFHNPNVLFAWDYSEIPCAPRREKPWVRTALELFEMDHLWVGGPEHASLRPPLEMAK